MGIQHRHRRSAAGRPSSASARLVASLGLIALVAGCSAGATPASPRASAPASIAASASTPASTSASHAPINIETMWADGTGVTMVVVSQVGNPAANILSSAPAMYVLGFPLDKATGKAVVPPDYTPQCHPCLQAPDPQTHDHVLASAGTTSAYLSAQQPWRPTILMYAPAFITGGHFTPVTDEKDLPAAMAAHEFLPIGPNGTFEKQLPVILILQRQGS